MANPPVGLSKELIALRVARELQPGASVNLGIGMPTLVSNFVPDDAGVLFQAENGILGYGGIVEDDFDPDLINASGQPVSLQPGAAFFDSTTSFVMIRGGHMDVAVLGGLQVSEKGDLANWFVPERGGGSVGGAMDLATGAKRLIIAMQHTTREGLPRIVTECDYPLTAPGCVDLIVTNLAVIEVAAEGLVLREVAEGVSAAEVQQFTGPQLRLASDLTEITF